jgi:hypothetical protein
VVGPGTTPSWKVEAYQGICRRLPSSPSYTCAEAFIILRRRMIPHSEGYPSSSTGGACLTLGTYIYINFDSLVKSCRRLRLFLIGAIASSIRRIRLTVFGVSFAPQVFSGYPLGVTHSVQEGILPTLDLFGAYARTSLRHLPSPVSYTPHIFGGQPLGVNHRVQGGILPTYDLFGAFARPSRRH